MTKLPGYEQITNQKMNSLYQGAKRRKLVFEITAKDIWEKYLIQDKKCAITNLSLSFQDKSASLDRIDNTKGYTKDNIQIIHRTINRSKLKLSIIEYKNLCHAVLTFRGLL